MSNRSELARPQRVLRQVPPTAHVPTVPPQPQQQQLLQRPTNQPRLSFGQRPTILATTATNPPPHTPTGNHRSTVGSTPSSHFANPAQPLPISTINTIPTTSTNTNYSRSGASHIPSETPFTPRKTTQTSQNDPQSANSHHHQHQIAQLQQSLAQVQDELNRYKSQYAALQISFSTQQSTIQQLESQLQSQLEYNQELLSQQDILKEQVLEDVLQYLESHGVDVIDFQQKINTKHPVDVVNQPLTPTTTPTTSAHFGCQHNSPQVQSSLQLYRQNAEDLINNTNIISQSINNSNPTATDQPLHLISSNNPIELSQQLDKMIISLGGATRDEYMERFERRLRYIESLSTNSSHPPSTLTTDDEKELQYEIHQFDQEFSTQLQTQYQQQCNNYIEQFLNPIGIGLADTTLQPLLNPTPTDHNATTTSAQHDDSVPLMYYNNETLTPELLSHDLFGLCDRLSELEQQNGSLLQYGDNDDCLDDNELIHHVIDFGLDDMGPYTGLDKPPVPQLQ